jgi:putative heme-binding domain-containing protein
LLSLVDPSAIVRKEYQSSLIALKDGRVISGLIGEQTTNQITVIESSTQKTIVPRSDIEEIRDSEKSVMPEDLYRKLSPSDLRDLFCYLQDGVSR